MTREHAKDDPRAHADPTAGRDAVIFVPGLGADWGDHRLDQTAQRIAEAFDRNAASAAARFSVKLSVEEEEYVPGVPTRRCTILREDASGSAPVLDLYAFYYQSALRDRFERRNLLVKALLVFAAIVIHLPKVLLAPFRKRSRRGLSRKDSIQVLQAIGMLFLLIVYMGFLIWAVYQTLTTTIPKLGGPNPSVTVPQTIVVIAALIGALIPGIREWISKEAVTYVSLIYYVLLGEQKQVIAGRFSSLVEHIAEAKDPVHPRIHILAYSFGSIVALDSVFPRGREPGVRLGLLDTMVTIGTPFDAIRTWWPKYFTERHSYTSHPTRWINVYAPADVLGSNFRNDTAKPEADQSVTLVGGKRGPLPENIVYAVGPALEEVGLVGLITLMGIRAHALYWEDAPGAESVYGVVIPEMYRDSAALA
jgi:hypothetical protein